jgi:Domain of unknown function (DUF4326)
MAESFKRLQFKHLRNPVLMSRKNEGPKRLPHETIVFCDRTNPILGNPHFLHNSKDDVEREKVLKQYQATLETDWARKGPIHGAIQDLARRVIAGEQIGAFCWCFPRKRCHVEMIVEKVKSVIRTIEPEHPFAQPETKPTKPENLTFGF